MCNTRVAAQNVQHNMCRKCDRQNVQQKLPRIKCAGQSMQNKLCSTSNEEENKFCIRETLNILTDAGSTNTKTDRNGHKGAVI